MALRDQTHPTPTQRTAFQRQVLLEDNDWQRPVELDDLRRAAAAGPPSRSLDPGPPGSAGLQPLPSCSWSASQPPYCASKPC